MADNYEYVPIELWMTIDGTRHEVSRFQSTHSVNGIPSAVAHVCPGRDVKTLEPSAIHSTVGSISYMTPAKVFLRIKSVEAQIFEGFTTFIGINRSSVIEVPVHLTGSLVELTFGSTLTNYLAPPTGQSYVLDLEKSSGAETSAVLFTGPDSGPRFATDLIGDAWKAIQQFLLNLSTEHSAVKVRFKDVDLEGELKSSNADAKEQLEKIQSINMALRGGAVTLSVARAIMQTVGSDSPHSLLQQSFWTKILSFYGPMLMFSIIPREPNKPICVPFLPGSRKIYNPTDERYTISANDYESVVLQRSIERPIKGVVLTSNVLSEDGAQYRIGERPLIRQGGSYGNPNLDKGHLLFFRAPPWTDRAIELLQNSALATGVNAKEDCGGTTGDKPAAEAGSSPDGKKSNEVCNDLIPMLKAYAQCIYVSECTKHRIMNIVGRLRLDIGPGSTVSIEGAPERIIGESDQLAQPMVGVVAQVSISIDSGGPSLGGSQSRRPSASTAFKLTNCRTEAENKDNTLSVESHPLYAQVWDGAPLVEGF